MIQVIFCQFKLTFFCFEKSKASLLSNHIGRLLQKIKDDNIIFFLYTLLFKINRLIICVFFWNDLTIKKHDVLLPEASTRRRTTLKIKKTWFVAAGGPCHADNHTKNQKHMIFCRHYKADDHMFKNMIKNNVLIVFFLYIIMYFYVF